MAITQADLDALNTAIVSSELEVELEGRRVRYRSVAELVAAYEHAKTVLATSATGASRAGSSFRFNFQTGRE
jgi:hypothetical protein